VELLLLLLDDELRAGLGIAGGRPTEDDPLPTIPTILPVFIFAFPLPPAKVLEFELLPFIIFEPALDEFTVLALDDDAASRPLLRFIPISSCCCILMFSRICF